MYLKTIIASGFKSFADKITIDLTDGITGIVGPNGSGKSNVVDAVRWVLGEQSVKSLRGDESMTDVIFSGSKSRNAMNVASVTLVFDNTDKYLKLEYDEVSIRRRVYRDGSNEYSINNEKCRLKDIVDILLDTGIAKESFNIISQGKIEEIISAKASERRLIFEEAAGVLKYKRRKADALHKLDRTHDNMHRVDDIIHELEDRVEPLKEQRDKALIYEEKANLLEKTEVALIVHDIDSIDEKCRQSRARIDILNEEIVQLGVTNSSKEATIEKKKVEVNELEEYITTLQNGLLEKTQKTEQLNSQKNILIERKKYDVEDTKLYSQLLDLKETKLKGENQAHIIESEIIELQNKVNSHSKKLEELEESIKKLKTNRFTLDQELMKVVREKQTIENTISNLQESIENGSALPSSVRSVLSHPTLRGIYDAIGNMIEVEEMYTTAITTALASSTSYVIVEDEKCAKEAINYLKSNNLGRVTFFPLNIIKPKTVDTKTLELIKSEKGFLALASSLIKFDPKFSNIIENQLGNVIVVDTIDSANYISRLISYRYRVITLDGELLHVGGSLTGGNLPKTKNVITERYALEKELKKQSEKVEQIKLLETKLNEIDYDRQSVEDRLYLTRKDKIDIEEKIQIKSLELKDLEKKIEQFTLEITGIESMQSNNISKEEEEVLQAYYKSLNEINEITHSIEINTKKKNSLKEDIEEYEFTMKKENSLYTAKNKELKDLEIEVNRLDVKLDTLLNRLNESYAMTYEHAKKLYILEVDSEEARTQVLNLKHSIKELGNINMSAIEEYEEVSKRYEFLLGQREDLVNAENVLLHIIEEMDTVMKQEFTKTFKVIQDNFTITFKELFKGGYAELKLTEPNNILETGVEIVASPPGKKLSSISLLSGGEKTFTAISLLFAILKSRPVPFCILDEVEAALDEVNVDSFGNYLKNLQEKTQFILITHKKRTMEYADVLYGITMQESGVSKLVSVKLEDIGK